MIIIQTPELIQMFNLISLIQLQFRIRFFLSRDICQFKVDQEFAAIHTYEIRYNFEWHSNAYIHATIIDWYFSRYTIYWLTFQTYILNSDSWLEKLSKFWSMNRHYVNISWLSSSNHTNPLLKLETKINIKSTEWDLFLYWAWLFKWS